MANKDKTTNKVVLSFLANTVEIFYKTPKNTIIGRYHLIELRPSIRSLDIESLGSLDQDRDQKCLKKMLVGNRRFSSFMLGKCLVLLENLFKTYAQDRSVIARNFPMLDHFSAGDRLDRKFKIKNFARDRSD